MRISDANGFFQEAFGVAPKVLGLHRQRLASDPALMRPLRRGCAQDPLGGHEVTNLVISVCAPSCAAHRYPDTVETVRLCRAAMRVTDDFDRAMNPPERFAGLSFGNAATFGEAIDGLLMDLRSGAFAAWCGPEGGRSWLKFYNSGSRIVIGAERFTPTPSERVGMVFRNDHNPGDRDSGFLTCVNEVDGIALERLAGLLGPPS